MTLIKLATKFLEPRARAFEAATKDPIEAQEKVLFEYLERNKDTEYGKKYDFAKIKSVEDYQRSVPMSDCELMRPYFDKMKKGEGTIGRLLNDDSIYNNLEAFTADIREHPWKLLNKPRGE